MRNRQKQEASLEISDEGLAALKSKWKQKISTRLQMRIINFNAQDQMATLYTRDSAIMRKVDALVIDYPDTFKCIGETDIDKIYEMPKAVVTYRKPRRITKEQRNAAKKRIGIIY